MSKQVANKKPFSRADIARAIARLQAEYVETQKEYNRTPGSDIREGRKLMNKLIALARKIERLQGVAAEGPKRKLPNPRYEIRKTYFAGDPNRGRTTTLLLNGKPVLEVIGIASKRTLVAQFENRLVPPRKEIKRNPRGLSAADIEKFPARYRSDISGQMAGMRPAPRAPQFGPLFSSVRLKKLKLAGGGAARQVQKLNPPQRYVVQWKDNKGNWSEGARKFVSQEAALRHAREVEIKHPGWIVVVAPEERQNPAAFIARDSSRTCYHCGKRIKKGSVLVAGPDRMPYHQKCYRQAEKDAVLELQRKRNPFRADMEAGSPKIAREVIAEHKDYLKRTWPGTETENRAFKSLALAYEYAGYDRKRAHDAAQRELDKKRKANPDIKCERCGQRYAIDSYCPICRADNPAHNALKPTAKYALQMLELETIHFKNTGRGLQLLKHAIGVARREKRKASIEEGKEIAVAIHGAIAAVRKGGRKNNPSIQQLSQTFQGKASGAISQFKASNSAPTDLARIGRLVFIKLGGASQVRVPGAMVAVDKTGRLWLVGNHAPMFTRKAKPGEALDFGEVNQLCYLTSKKHIGNGASTEYVHSFGEDGGRKPHLLVDSEGMPILRGGDYKIKSEGIVN